MVNNKALDVFAEIDTHRLVTSEEMADFHATDAALADKIIAVLSKIDADIESKREFAYDIIAEMEYLLWDADDKTPPLKKKDKLRKAALKIRKQLGQFHELLRVSQNKIGNDLSAVGALRAEIANVQRVMRYFDRISNDPLIIKSLNGQKGQRNIHGQKVAKYLVKRWKEYFGEPPKSGKGESPEKHENGKNRRRGEQTKTDYDLLCELLNQTYGINISYDARRLTFQKRKGNKKEPKNSTY